MKKLKSFGDLPVWYFEWHDHYSQSGWDDIAGIKGDKIAPAVCKSVGFVVHEDKTHVWLATTIGVEEKSNKGYWSGKATSHMVILKSCIVKKKPVYVKS